MKFVLFTLSGLKVKLGGIRVKFVKFVNDTSAGRGFGSGYF